VSESEAAARRAVPCFLDPQLLHVSSSSPLLSLMLRGASRQRSAPLLLGMVPLRQLRDPSALQRRGRCLLAGSAGCSDSQSWKCV
jgi:hypothetical protein